VIAGRGHRAGFTMVELMISLVISSLLVGMILSIFMRMSTAYRTQQHIAELQQILTSAQDLIQRDVRQAGFQMPDGFRIVGAAGVHPAIELRDNAGGFGPDELHVFYADASAQAKVMVMASLDVTPFTTFTVDDPDRFDDNDVVLISNHSISTNVGAAVATVVRFEACVVQLQQIAGAAFTVRTGGTWGDPNNNQCDAMRAKHVGAVTNTMVYRFRARGYRVDPTRRSLAVLQLSPTGGLVPNDWQDLGIGFTDLQLASRWYEDEDADVTLKAGDTADVDNDPLREWYSDNVQDARTSFVLLTAPTDPSPTARSLLMELRVSLAVRTSHKLDTIGSSQTPAFIDAARPANNDLGNRAAVTLAGVADGARPEELRGDHLYRYSTVGSDTRNLSVGR